MPRGGHQPQDGEPVEVRTEGRRPVRPGARLPAITEERDTGAGSPRFLSEDERIVIADLPRAKKSLHAIARELGRTPATISREVRRNRDPRTGKYHPFQAQRRAAVRRARSKEGKTGRDPELKEFIQQHLACTCTCPTAGDPSTSATPSCTPSPACRPTSPAH
nr:helix-turn-helix domain-containing protein [Streptomyces dioscori]